MKSYSKIMAGLIYLLACAPSSYAQQLPSAAPYEQRDTKEWQRKAEQESPFKTTDLISKAIGQILKNKELLKVAIGSLTFFRCAQLLPVGENLLDCSIGAEVAVKYLDFHQMESRYILGQTVRLSFRRELIKLMTDPKLSIALESWNKESFERVEQGKNINLSDLMAGSSFSIMDRLRTLAVLLQDTSTYRLHLIYIDHLLEDGFFSKTQRPIVESNLASLRSFMDYLQLHSASISTLPEKYGLNLKNIPSVDNGFYHFYVVAYLAAIMEPALIRVTRRNSLYINYISAFSFNYFYEVLNLPQFKDKSWGTVLLEMLSLSSPIITSPHTATDIYLGHLGALYGSGKFGTLIGREEFLKGLAKNPTALYQRMARDISQLHQ